MLHLNRKTEYALLAMSFLVDLEGDAVASVNEISERYQLPTMLLSKVMQRLKKYGYVCSIKGCSGGYSLACVPSEIPLVKLLQDMDESMQLVTCQDDDGEYCKQFDACRIRDPIHNIEARIADLLSTITVADAIGGASAKANVA